MAGIISCCLNLPLLDPNSKQLSSPLVKTTSRISWRRTEDETEPRKNKCSLALAVAATVVIGLIQTSDVASVEAAVVKSSAKEVVPRRWSDKRTCPPWLENSLETIVPENLPRPSTHRRLELAGLAKRDAPQVGAVVTRVNRDACFSL
ncbi:hypothetical protein EUTSA_v10000347mg [Eutrema salsugineum]|uniref:Uncharacterized protein n=1 Tax=Eutrema salsugineum TaxID=72664 RepID=V4NK14_EUTSA|nr:uncharacterized protein LOC18022286 [Eutrema salsugineum]ESQ46686.1 hypothetical protein EUTSA_v10000347mg [Eutrema salsugineum]